ncbi:MAG: hypothetical protein U1E40_05695 [Amaricoccus sp.]
MTLAGAAASVWLAATAERAEADFVFSMAQVGPDVVLTGQGSMYVHELFDDMAPQQALIVPRINPGAPSATLSGGSLGAVDTYSMVIAETGAPFSITGPANFGTGGYTSGSAGIGGDSFGFGFADGGANRSFSVYVPTGYTGAGDQGLNGSTTFFNQTYASLGITPGSYAWALQSAIEPLTENISVSVAPAPIPLPPSALLLGAGVLALVAVGAGNRKRTMKIS